MLLHAFKPGDKPSFDKETNTWPPLSLLKLIKTINLTGLLLRGRDVQYTIFIVAASVLPPCIATGGDETEKTQTLFLYSPLLEEVGRKIQSKSLIKLFTLEGQKSTDLHGDVFDCGTRYCVTVATSDRYIHQSVLVV